MIFSGWITLSIHSFVQFTTRSVISGPLQFYLEKKRSDRVVGLSFERNVSQLTRKMCVDDPSSFSVVPRPGDADIFSPTNAAKVVPRTYVVLFEFCPVSLNFNAAIP